MAAIATDTIVGVVGAGTMGAGIAQVAAQAGHPVRLHDAAPGAAEAGRERIARGLERLIERGRRSREEVAALLERIEPVGSLDDLAPCGLVVEAVVEALDVKQALFRDLERLCSADAILATNTSSLSVTAIAAPLEDPTRLAGMHFFNPAPVMRLVEVVHGLATGAAVADTVADTCRAWGKTPVHVRSTPGFIVNRVARPFYGEALRLVEEQAADAATIDALMREAGGFRMGPFELMDLIGLDVNLAVTETVHHATFDDPRYRPSWLQQELVRAGRLGRKSGRGFYGYGETDPRPEPATAAPGPRPDAVTVAGDPGPLAALVEAAATAGIAVRRTDGPGLIEVGAARIALSDGRPATLRARTEGIEGLVCVDLALDYAAATRLALAPSAGTAPAALADACGFLQALGKAVSVVADAPGMVVMRTVAMLVNEAAELIGRGIASPTDTDTAMRLGVNYPLGPLAWGDALGAARVLAVIEHLAEWYREDRYRPADRLRRAALTGTALAPAAT